MHTPKQNPSLRRVIAQAALPTLPEVMQRVMECVDDPLSCAQDLTRVLESDSAITARVLRLANSAFYGCRFQVDTVRRAVIIIGFDGLRLLALATGVMSAFPSPALTHWRPRELWLHSLGAAKAAQMLGQLHYPDLPEHLCFTAGLLHDLGKLVLAVSQGDAYGDVLLQARARREPLWQAEQRVLGVTSADIGALVCDEWNFPREIVEALREQVHPSRAVGPRNRLAEVVCAANTLSRLADYGDAGEVEPVTVTGVHLGCAVPQDELEEIIQRLRSDLPHAVMLLQGLEVGVAGEHAHE